MKTWTIVNSHVRISSFSNHQHYGTSFLCLLEPIKQSQTCHSFTVIMQFKRHICKHNHNAIIMPNKINSLLFDIQSTLKFPQLSKKYFLWLGLLKSESKQYVVPLEIVF